MDKVKWGFGDGIISSSKSSNVVLLILIGEIG
jgi:hypothetical protein